MKCWKCNCQMAAKWTCAAADWPISHLIPTTSLKEAMNWLNILAPSKLTCDHAALEKFESRLGRRLPGPYRKFLVAYNSGTIVVDHTLTASLYEEPVELAVMGVFSLAHSVETQNRWQLNDFGSDSALPIADDGGTGFYFFLLDDRHWGQIYFSYKEDFWTTPRAEWVSGSGRLPVCMVLVGKNFARLGKLIEKGMTPPQG